ncbi:hypothetical protein [Fusobacterium necrophorum]|uniref:hypothetical protein n=1 Tax=Fusobacterium necrophorum TaxID=859 RepID=UPI0001BC58E1
MITAMLFIGIITYLFHSILGYIFIGIALFGYSIQLFFLIDEAREEDKRRKHNE